MVSGAEPAGGGDGGGAPYGPETYGEAFADVYDDWYSDISDVDATVATVAELATGVDPDGRRRIVELGVGTGRLAIPLAARVAPRPVLGVDASPAMLDRLIVNDPGGAVETAEVDMADAAALASVVAPGEAAVVFVAFNTLFNVTTDQGQRTCLAAAADALVDGGVLAVECFVPDLDGPSDTDISPKVIDGGIVLNVSARDRDRQLVQGRQVQIDGDGIRIRPWAIRYLSPGQVDGLAADSGLRLEARWADWDRTPFGAESTRHVSIYRKG